MIDDISAGILGGVILLAPIIIYLIWDLWEFNLI